jgi:predicted HicB family RNase H-like nuclease
MNTPAKALRRGRPELPPQEARGLFEKIRVNEREQKAFKRAAKKQRIGRSEWIRKTLLEAAQAA